MREYLGIIVLKSDSNTYHAQELPHNSVRITRELPFYDV